MYGVKMMAEAPCLNGSTQCDVGEAAILGWRRVVQLPACDEFHANRAAVRRAHCFSEHQRAVKVESKGHLATLIQS
jgi:hypothetical protein